MSNKSTEQSVNDLIEFCKEIAKTGKNYCETNLDYCKDNDLWEGRSTEKIIELNNARVMLENLGYKVEFYNKYYQDAKRNERIVNGVRVEWQ